MQPRSDQHQGGLRGVPAGQTGSLLQGGLEQAGGAGAGTASILSRQGLAKDQLRAQLSNTGAIVDGR